MRLMKAVAVTLLACLNTFCCLSCSGAGSVANECSTTLDDVDEVAPLLQLSQDRKASRDWHGISDGLSAKQKQDRMTALPGWASSLASRMFSGFIDAGESLNIKMWAHYMFFESESAPRNDPLIVWTNGGPAATSLFGALTEIGPYYLSTASVETDAYKATGVPTLFRNKYAWTRFANLLILNCPPPVGFSYCDPVGPTGDGYSCGPWNDTSMAQHTTTFMLNWMTTFPQYREHDTYIIGESYGGIYVPMLTQELRAREAIPHLKGIAVGNGCIGNKPCGCRMSCGKRWDVDFFYGHDQISSLMYQLIHASCSSLELDNGATCVACKDALAQMTSAIGGYDSFNIYDQCNDPTNPPHEPMVAASYIQGRSDIWPTKEDYLQAPTYPCGGLAALDLWANSPVVKEALHVSRNASFFNVAVSAGPAGLGITYNQTEPDLRPFYKDVVDSRALRILIYNGDTDASGNGARFGENWTSSLGLRVNQPWRPWTLSGQEDMAGYVTRYEGDFDFVTIRGGGHQVPLYRPAATHALIHTWLKRQDYPHYKRRSRRAVHSNRSQEANSVL